METTDAVTSWHHVDAAEFVASWCRLDAEDLASTIERLRGEPTLTVSAAACLRHSPEIGASLRHHRRRREASLAAHEAIQAVLAAGDRTGVAACDRAGLNQLARVAGDVARGLAAEVRTGALDDLLGLLGTRRPVPGVGRCATLA